MASMIYFDSDMSKSTNTVVNFDWKTVHPTHSGFHDYFLINTFILIANIIMKMLKLKIFSNQLLCIKYGSKL
jgi:hypothetical protein